MIANEINHLIELVDYVPSLLILQSYDLTVLILNFLHMALIKILFVLFILASFQESKKQNEDSLQHIF